MPEVELSPWQQKMLPQNASVFDPSWMKTARAIAHLLGVDDPTAAIMGTVLPAPAPGEGGAVEYLAQRFPKFAETLGIKAYHGSPHDFEQFSTAKIGTGEGAQAYGHGLYFAEKEGTARAYRDDLSPVNINHRADGAPISLDVQRMIGDAWNTLRGRTLTKPGIGNALDLVDEGLMRQRASAMTARDADWFNQIEDMRLEVQRVREHPPQHQGKMYEVAIKADPEHFLDWDKPLSEQPKIVEKLRQRGYVDAPWPYTDKLMHPSGGTFVDLKEGGESAYRGLVNLIRDTGSRAPGARLDARAAQELASQGIPGIKYLDQGSRAAGEGSRNYVVFDDKTIDILRKYGILLPAAGLGAARAPGKGD